jgi:hypothetical protein
MYEGSPSGDIDLDGDVDFADFVIMTFHWLEQR